MLAHKPGPNRQCALPSVHPHQLFASTTRYLWKIHPHFTGSLNLPSEATHTSWRLRRGTVSPSPRVVNLPTFEDEHHSHFDNSIPR